MEYINFEPHSSCLEKWSRFHIWLSFSRIRSGVHQCEPHSCCLEKWSRFHIWLSFSRIRSVRRHKVVDCCIYFLQFPKEAGKAQILQLRCFGCCFRLIVVFFIGQVAGYCRDFFTKNFKTIERVKTCSPQVDCCVFYWPGCQVGIFNKQIFCCMYFLQFPKEAGRAHTRLIVIFFHRSGCWVG